MRTTNYLNLVKSESEELIEVISNKLSNALMNTSMNTSMNTNMNNSNTSQILENLNEFVIQYSTSNNEKVNSIYIMGDFTNWEPVLMHKSKEKFSYNTVLMKGFKYYFVFQVQDTIMPDMNQVFEENPRNLQVNNFVDYTNNVGSSTPFDFALHYNLLTQARKTYTHANMNETDSLLLNNIVEISDKVKSYIDKFVLKKEADIKALNYAVNNKKICHKFLNEANQICEMFKNRIMLYNDRLYKIFSIDLSSSHFRVCPLYDLNGC